VIVKKHNYGRALAGMATNLGCRQVREIKKRKKKSMCMCGGGQRLQIMAFSPGVGLKGKVGEPRKSGARAKKERPP